MGVTLKQAESEPVEAARTEASLRNVQDLLGHRSLSTTERYLRLTITDLKEAHTKFILESNGKNHERLAIAAPKHRYLRCISIAAEKVAEVLALPDRAFLARKLIASLGPLPEDWLTKDVASSHDRVLRLALADSHSLRHLRAEVRAASQDQSGSLAEMPRTEAGLVRTVVDSTQRCRKTGSGSHLNN